MAEVSRFLLWAPSCSPETIAVIFANRLSLGAVVVAVAKLVKQVSRYTSFGRFLVLKENTRYHNMAWNPSIVSCSCWSPRSSFSPFVFRIPIDGVQAFAVVDFTMCTWREGGRVVYVCRRVVSDVIPETILARTLTYCHLWGTRESGNTRVCPC